MDAIPACKAGPITLEPLDPKTARATLDSRLITALTTAPTHEQPTAHPLPSIEPGCIMGRDPAIPTETSVSHTLYAPEAQAIASIWGVHMFEQPGLTIVYRESPAHLDEVMPLSLYSDMYHNITLHRAGLVVQSGLPLTACGCGGPP